MSVISFRQSLHIDQRVWAKFVKLNKNNMLSEYYKEDPPYELEWEPKEVK